MNDTIKMQISAFVDGELPDNESELLLRRLSQDAELRQAVAHYLEIGRYVRRESEVPEMEHLRGRIAEALGGEAHVPETQDGPVRNKLVKPIAGFAVAASVALLAILGLQQAGGPSATDVDANPGSVVFSQPATDNRLDEMFRRHENTSGGAGSSANLAEFVAFDIDQAELVRVEPKAQLLSPVEIESEIEDDDTDDDDTEDEKTDANTDTE
jgi:hypothetical protein